MYILRARNLKLKILTRLATESNLETLLREYATYIKESNSDVQISVIRSLATINTSLPRFIDSSLTGVYNVLTSSKHVGVIRECVLALRLMTQHAMRNGSDTAIDLMRRLFRLLVTEIGIEDAEARAAIVWLAGEYQIYFSDLVPDVLRLLAVTFSDEAVVTRMQILNFAVKLSLVRNDEADDEDQKIQDLMTYVLEMARYDMDTDLRDRSRYFTALLGLAPNNESAVIDEDALEELANRAHAILCTNKPPSRVRDGNAFTLGSLSSVMQHCVSGYVPLCDWPEIQPDPTVRDTTGDIEYKTKRETANTISTHFSDSDESKSDTDSNSSDSSSSDSDSTSGSSESDSEEEVITPKKHIVQTTTTPAPRPLAERKALRRVKGQGRSNTQHHVVNILNMPEASSLVSNDDMMLLDMSQPPPVVSPPITSHEYSDIQNSGLSPSPYIAVSTPPLESSSAFSGPNDISSSDSIMAQIMESFNINPASARTSETDRPSPLQKQCSLPNNAAAASSPAKDILSIPKIILSGELSSGLCVSLRFRHHARAVTIPGGSSVALVVKNTSDYTIRYNTNGNMYSYLL